MKVEDTSKEADVPSADPEDTSEEEEEKPPVREELPEEPVKNTADSKDFEENSKIISEHFFEDLFSDLPAGFLDDVSDDISNLLS